MPTREQLIERAVRRCQVQKATSEADYVRVLVALDLARLTDGEEKAIAYDPDHLDPMLDAAQTGVVRRFWREAPALSVSAWIEREARRFTVTPPTETVKRRANEGKSRLAAALLGLPYTKETRAMKPFKALLRSLQRSAPPTKAGRKESHKTVVKPEYRTLIDKYAGEQSPFRASGKVDMERIAQDMPILAVTGDWQISTRKYTERTLTTVFLTPYNAQTWHEARAVLRNDGAEFIEVVERHANRVIDGGAVQLSKVYALYVQINVVI